ATITVGTTPASIAFAAGSTWVGDFTADKLYRINPTSNKVVATIPLHGPVVGILGAPDGSVWASEYSAGTVAHIDPPTNTGTGRGTVGGDAEALAFAAGRLWVTNGSGYVSEINPTTRAQLKKLTVGNDVDAIVATPHQLWVTTYYAGIVARIDPVLAKVAFK